MESRTEELGNEIQSVRHDFEAKREDSSVPGLPPRPEQEREQSVGGSEEPQSPAPEAPPDDEDAESTGTGAQNGLDQRG